MNNSSPDQLQGWDEIAIYLGVTRRTAQKWENEFRLPVHRFPGSRGRVWAVKSELDAWKIETPPPTRDEPSAAESEPSNPSPSNRHWHAVTAILALTIVVAVALVWIANAETNRPTSITVAGNSLTAYDHNGKILWHHIFPVGPTTPPPELHRLFKFADLDGDGKIETLYIYDNAEAHEHFVYCFEQNGKIRWIYKPSGTVSVNGKQFSPPYWISWIQVSPPGPGNRRQIVIAAHHIWSFPQQIAVVDRFGKVQSEYWHHGHLLWSALTDIGGNNKPRLVVSGLDDNPDYDRATVLVFDLANIKGSSLKIDGSPDFDGMPPGSAERVVFFPKSRISHNVEFNRASDVTRSTAGVITVAVAEGIDMSCPYVMYELDKQWRPLYVTFSDRMKEMYRVGFAKQASELMRSDQAELLRKVISTESSLSAAEAIRRESKAGDSAQQVGMLNASIH